MDKQSALSHAIGLHKQGKLTEAQQSYEKILAEHAADADVLHLIGIAYGQSGDFPKAQYYVEQALRKSPQSPTYHNSLAQILNAQGDAVAAEIYYQQSLQYKPLNPAVHNNLGILYLTKDQLEQATAHFTQAIQQKTDFADAYFNLGLVLLKQNKPKAAQKQFSHCLHYEPRHPQANSQLGQLYQADDQLKAAIACYQARLEAEPEHANTHHLLATAWLKAGDDAQAIKAFQRTLELDPQHAETHHNLAAIYLLQNKLERALEHWHAQLAIAPDIDTYYNLGVVYHYQDHFDDAIQFFQQALELDKNYLNAHINLAAVYLKRNDAQQACFHYQQAQAIDPTNPSVNFVLDALQQGDSAAYQQAPSEYVRDLFDQYAPHFDQHLNECLQYRAPTYCLQALQAALPADAPRFESTIDLGCGSGLCGPLFKPLTNQLIGVDISPKMLEQAGNKGCYNQLDAADIVSWLEAHSASADLILAADVLPYLGDLQPLFSAVAARLNPQGYWVFTVEKGEQPGFTLTRDARFQHQRETILELLTATGFQTLSCQSMTTRMQQKTPVVGLVVVAQPN